MAKREVIWSMARSLGNKASGRGAMSHIATVAVALSLCVMIVTVAVVAGFREEMSSLIRRVAADAVVSDITSFRAFHTRPIKDTAMLREMIEGVEGTTSVDAFASCGGVARSEEAMVGMLLKGMERKEGLSLYGEHIVEGSLPRFEAARYKEVIISQCCAERLGVGTSDRIELLFLEEGGAPRRELFKVCGVYDTGIDEGESVLMLTDIRNVRKINGWSDDEITGYEIRYDRFEKAEARVEQLNERLLWQYEGDESITAVSSAQLYSGIFSWLATHDVNAAVILVIMVVVALFNMVSALLILVLQRVKMIGVLRTLGMAASEVRRIFVARSLILTLRGLVAGNIVALLLVVAQKYWHIVKLDAVGYNVTYVPVCLKVEWVVATDLAFVGVVMCVMALTTTIVSRIRPAEILRYE